MAAALWIRPPMAPGFLAAAKRERGDVSDRPSPETLLQLSAVVAFHREPGVQSDWLQLQPAKSQVATMKQPGPHRLPAVECGRLKNSSEPGLGAASEVINQLLDHPVGKPPQPQPYPSILYPVVGM